MRTKGEGTDGVSVDGERLRENDTIVAQCVEVAKSGGFDIAAPGVELSCWGVVLTRRRLYDHETSVTLFEARFHSRHERAAGAASLRGWMHGDPIQIVG